MLSVDILIHFFDYFYNKISDTKGKTNKTPTNTKVAQSFLSLIEKEYGQSANKEFLYTYFIFQFSYWDGVEFTGSNSYNSGVQLSFIIGKKAFDRYKKRNKEFDWQLNTATIINKYSLKKSDLVKIERFSTKHKIEVKKGLDTEAAIKLPFYNTHEGYDVCGDYSTMYNHKSSICEGCDYKDDCKKRLLKIYPTLYTDRGYK